MTVGVMSAHRGVAKNFQKTVFLRKLGLKNILLMISKISNCLKEISETKF